MKKLIICCNHSFKHCGGTERVIQQISESMNKDFGWKTFVFSQTTKNSFSHNGVNYLSINQNADFFIDQINKISPDYLFVYSDFFIHWITILCKHHLIKCRKGIALVGANMMLSRIHIWNNFVSNHNFFDVITHSDNYQDYKACVNSNIPVTVIPNGVDLKEFSQENIDFKKKYQVNSKYVILCVANFFPGKGQEHLIKILDKLSSDGIDFTAIFICSTVNFAPANILRESTRKQLKTKSFKWKILLDIPREDVISAYKSSDVFVFPSQKEVAPLVILEAMAANLPWVSMPVGNVSQLEGGMIVRKYSKDLSKNQNEFFKDGLFYTEETYGEFIFYIKKILEEKSLRNELSLKGKSQILEYYSWDKIAPKYNQIFEGNNGTSG